MSSENCNTTLKLTIDPDNASSASLAHEGECPAADRLDKDIRINNTPRAVMMLRMEEDKIESLHLEKACSASSTESQDSEEALPESDAECIELAKDKFKSEQESCINTHNYREHITRGDAYLDCLASALGVERPSLSESSKDDPEEPQGCQIPGIGWLVCQLSEFLAYITDNTFSLLQPFLKVEPLSTEVSIGQTSSTYTTWAGIRDIANVFISIGFLVVVFSHLTGIGIQAYNIKKGRPKLIVSSVLINTSFFICAVFVDVSNIIGASLQDSTKYFATSTISQSSTFTDWPSVTNRVMSITPTDKHFNQQVSGVSSDSEDDGENEESQENPESSIQDQADPEAYTSDVEDTTMIINGKKIVGSAVLYANLVVLLPLMIFSLFSIFAALMLLLFRQALIIILVVISPLAFAALILPGTKQWFSKWQSTSMQLLMIYPVIILIYVASQIASEAIRDSAANNGHTLMAIFSLAIQTIPLFVAPLILKFGGSAMNQFGGMIKGATRAPKRAAIDKAKEYREQRKQIKNARLANVAPRVAQFAPGNLMRSYKTGQRMKERRLDEARKRHYAENMDSYLKGIKDSNLVSDMAAEADAAIFDIDVDNVNATQNMLEYQGLSQNEAISMATTGLDKNGKPLTEIQQRAAARFAMQNATPEEAHKLLEAAGSGSLPQSVSQEISNNASATGVPAKSFEVSQSVIGGLASGNQNMNTAMKGAIESGRLSPESAPLQAAATMRRARVALDSVSQDSREEFTERLVEGLISENAHDGKADTLQEMSNIINDGIDRGDITIDDIASILSKGKPNDSTAAYREILSEKMKRGTFDIGQLMGSDSFINSSLNNTSTLNALADTAVGTIAQSANSTNFNTLNSSTMDLYTKGIDRALTNPADADIKSIKSYVSKVKSLTASSNISIDNLDAANRMISTYNRHVPPEDRV